MKCSRPLTAEEKRAQHPDFIPTFSLRALCARLPLRFPVPEGTPPSPKPHYRSQYEYPGTAVLEDPQQVARLSPFEIALHLIDFSPLRDYLAQAAYAASPRGHVPFDPVSMLLALFLRRQLQLSWRGLACLLAGEHGAGWRRLLGFREGCTPSPSGLRHFFNAVGEEVFEELCCLFADLLHQAGLLPERSTFPGDPPHRGVSISHDTMLHEARSRLRCAYVNESCYQPLASRRCAAREAGQRGCSCDEERCRDCCVRATPRDREARFIHYDGRNKEGDLAGAEKGGRDVYGYRSSAIRLIDDRFACAWTLRIGLYPANTDERDIFPKSYTALLARFPWLRVGEVLADAALGYECCLKPIWESGALRMVDIRAAEGDRDREKQLQRGYNEHGHPLCPHGYPMHPNGHDYGRRRTAWCCEKGCEQEDGQAPPDCPYRAAEYRHGYTVHVGYTLPDGSVRLAREIPYGSAHWKARYGRRNLSESRNASLEGMGLKRMPGYGLSRGRKEMALADVLVNLETLGRLVQEATRLAAQRG